jgi:hypothetical protein
MNGGRVTTDWLILLTDMYVPLSYKFGESTIVPENLRYLKQ